MMPHTEVDRDDAKAFGAWVRYRRTQRGRSADALARAAGISSSGLYNIERGGRNYGGHWSAWRPQDQTLTALAQALDVPEAEMFRRAPGSCAGGEVDLRLPDDVDTLVGRIDRLVVAVEQLVAVLA